MHMNLVRVQKRIAKEFSKLNLKSKYYAKNGLVFSVYAVKYK